MRLWQFAGLVPTLVQSVAPARAKLLTIVAAVLALGCAVRSSENQGYIVIYSKYN